MVSAVACWRLYLRPLSLQCGAFEPLMIEAVGDAFQFTCPYCFNKTLVEESYAGQKGPAIAARR